METRTWKCADCGKTVTLTYDEYIESGTPICTEGGCRNEGEEMEIQDDPPPGGQAKAKAEPFRVLVVVEGGCVTDVTPEHTPPEGFEYILKDFDNFRDGPEPAREFLAAHKDAPYDPKFKAQVLEDVEKACTGEDDPTP